MSLPILFGLLLAAGCAVATNVASVLKHRGANAVPALRLRHPLRSVRLLFGSRWFALGMGLAVCAGVLHIVALALAPMSIVQVVLAGGVVLLAGAAEAVKRLNDADVLAVVVTNQSGIARGLYGEREYEAVRRRLDELLAARGARLDVRQLEMTLSL
jgi:hypothetical protein